MLKSPVLFLARWFCLDNGGFSSGDQRTVLKFNNSFESLFELCAVMCWISYAEQLSIVVQKYTHGLVYGWYRNIGNCRLLLDAELRKALVDCKRYIKVFLNLVFGFEIESIWFFISPKLLQWTAIIKNCNMIFYYCFILGTPIKSTAGSTQFFSRRLRYNYLVYTTVERGVIKDLKIKRNINFSTTFNWGTTLNLLTCIIV